jgi:hypothetical protein
MKTFRSAGTLSKLLLSAGVLHWSEGALPAAGFFLLVLLSHVMFFGFLAFNTMGSFFYDAASAVQSRGSVLGQWKWFRVWQNQRNTASAGIGPVEWAFDHLSWVRPDVRALLVKDVRMFWRA